MVKTLSFHCSKCRFNPSGRYTKIPYAEWCSQKKKTQKETYLLNTNIIKAMVLPVVMYGCERWTIKNVEH